jgi:glutathione S-transferase
MRLSDGDIRTREVLTWEGVHLLHFQGSSCSQKSRIFLRQKGIAWVSHPVDLARQQNYTPWFLGINPRGLVPVLVHDGAVHIESNDILTHLDDHFPGPKLIPAEHRELILARLRDEDDLHLDLRALTMRFVVPKRFAMKTSRSLRSYEEDGSGTVQGEPDPHKEVELDFWRRYGERGIPDADAASSARKFQAEFDELESRLAGHPHLLGHEITLLDIAWFIYVHRLQIAGYPFARLHPRVHAWAGRLLALPAFAEEVRSPVPLRLASGALRIGDRLRGRTLERVAGF